MKYFIQYEEYVKEIKKFAENLLGDVEVYVFGSVIEGRYHPVLSDIDVAIVTDNEDVGIHSALKLKVQKKFGDVFELHILDSSRWEFYRRFIGKVLRIE